MNAPLFDQLYQLLVTANAQTNLTRLTSPEDFAQKHVADSLTLLPYLPEQAKVIDLGSGAGFPALPLAMIRPDLQITAVESVGKKCQFIEKAAAELGLSNIIVVNERIEVLGRDSTYRRRFDVVTARALAPLRVLLEYAMPLATYSGGCFLAFKGPQYRQELSEAQNALAILQTTLAEMIPTAGPERDGAVLLRFTQTAPVPDAYPRAVGVPAKKPL